MAAKSGNANDCGRITDATAGTDRAPISILGGTRTNPPPRRQSPVASDQSPVVSRQSSEDEEAGEGEREQQAKPPPKPASAERET